MVKYSNLSVQFNALSQPVRLKMVEQLSRRGRLSISNIARPFAISLPAALKHTQVLERSGLIVRSKEGRTQYCALNPHAFKQLVEWLTSQQMFWEASFARLERHINSITNSKRKKYERRNIGYQENI
jgi:DNA-binding transcriptional ArsR family regulator